MTQEDKDAALAKLERLLRARAGLPGYATNVRAIKAEIEALKAQPGSEATRRRLTIREHIFRPDYAGQH